MRCIEINAALSEKKRLSIVLFEGQLEAAIARPVLGEPAALNKMAESRFFSLALRL